MGSKLSKCASRLLLSYRPGNVQEKQDRTPEGDPARLVSFRNMHQVYCSVTDFKPVYALELLRRDSEMAQWAEALAIKPDNLSSVP